MQLTDRELQAINDALRMLSLEGWKDAPAAIRKLLASHNAGAQTHKIIDDGEVVGYVVPSIAAYPQPMTDAARDMEMSSADRISRTLSRVPSAKVRAIYEKLANIYTVPKDGEVAKQYYMLGFIDGERSIANAPTLGAHPQPITDAARDAKRYQWLRNEHFPTADNPPLAQVVWKLNSERRGNKWVNIIDGNDLDSAIDAEIERGEREGS